MTKELVRTLKGRLDKNNPMPLYFQIEREIEELIGKGLIKSGEKLPGDILLSTQLGVSHLTVRKALSRLVEKKTINRIKKAGTFVNPSPRPHNPTVGFFYFKEAETLMTRAAEYMQAFLSPRGYDLKIFGFEQGFYDEVDLCEEIRRGALRAAVFVLVDDEGCRRAIGQLEKSGFPHARFGNRCFVEELRSPISTGNDPQAIRDAVNLLWARGHRNIGLISSWAKSDTEDGYRRLMDKIGVFRSSRRMSLEFSGPLSEWRKLPGSHIARGFLEANPDMTGLIVECAPMVVDIYRQAELMGRKIPDDLSVISLRDWGGLEMLDPPATAFTVPVRAMAENAAAGALDVLEKGFPKKGLIIYNDYPLVERESVAGA